MLAQQTPLLVTGAAGLIGSAFVRNCNSRGIPVVSVDTLRYFDERPEHRGVDFGRRIDLDALAGHLARGELELSGIVHMGACTDTTELDVDYLKRVNVEYSQMLWQHATELSLPF